MSHRYFLSARIPLPACCRCPASFEKVSHDRTSILQYCHKIVAMYCTSLYKLKGRAMMCSPSSFSNILVAGFWRKCSPIPNCIRLSRVVRSISIRNFLRNVAVHYYPLGYRMWLSIQSPPLKGFSMISSSFGTRVSKTLKT
jgi:hypothetical protein